jgi:hypothetical protein
VEWPDLVAKLGLTGTSAMLAFAVYTLWKKLEAKDAEIQALNRENRETLIAVSKHSDGS